MSSSLYNNNPTDHTMPWNDANIRTLLYVFASTVGAILLVWCGLCLGTIIVGITFYRRQSRSKMNDTQRSLLRLESKSPVQSDLVKLPNSIEENEK